MKLRYSADRRTLAVIGAYFLVLGAGFALPLSWLWTPLLVITLCGLSFVCAVITHNTVHAPMFRERWANRVVQVVLTLTYGHPVSAFVPGHNLSHHRFTQTDRDLMRTSKLRYRSNLVNQILFGWVVGPPIFASNLRFAMTMRTRRPRWFRQLMLETLAFVGFVVGAFLVDPLSALLFVVVPHQYAAWGIMGINYVQHDGCDASSPWNHSRNFTGRWVNLITFNNGYHGIHHMHPSLHWSLLPERHADELTPHIHPELEQANFPSYLVRAYVWPGQRMTYDGKPYDPAPAGEDVDWVPQADRILTPADLGAQS